MKSLQLLGILATSFLILNTPKAIAQNTVGFQPKILKSDYATGGSIGYEHFGGTSNFDSYDQFKLSTNLNYFLIDHLALGMIANITTHESGSANTVANLGPAAIYFFWTQDRLASYLSGNVRFGLNDATLVSVLEGAVGLQLFFTESVGFGPKLYFVHDTSHYELNNRNDYGLEFSFGIYL